MPILRWILAALLLAAPLARPAFAQAEAQPAAVSAADLERLVATLEDEAARRTLVAQLKALIEAQRGVAATEAPLPDRIGARVLSTISDRLVDIGDAIFAAAAFIADAPQIFRWLGAQLGDDATRDRLLEVLGKLALVLVAGWLAEWLAARLLAPARVSIETRPVAGGWRRLLSSLLHALVALGPILVFAAVAYTALTLIAPSRTTSLVTLALINANLIARAVGLLAWIVLAPRMASLRLVPLGDETATYLYVWTRRFASLFVYGYFIATAALILGLPYAGYVFLMKLLNVALALLLIVLILQNRAEVAAAIRGEAEAAGGSPGLRRRFADYWHLVAVAYVGMTCIISLLQPGPSFDFLARGTVLTLALILAARLVVFLLRRAIERAFRISEDLRKAFPGLEARANRYLHLVGLVVAPIVYGFAALAIFQAWGLRSLEWVTTEFGRRVGASVISVVVTLAVALLVWEVANATFERYVRRADQGGIEGLRRGARLRTMFPFVQRVLFAGLAVFVAMIALSEVGINIAPLLAGAGVVGIAVGFGAQTLVKDFITGVGLVLEDALAVGDVVKLGDMSGVVEQMSLRSVRLRDFSGTVHTIPFSAVQIVSNLTKDFAFAVFDIGVGYEADVDHVIAVIKAEGAALRGDETLGRVITADLEVVGVDKFLDSAVVIKARFRTLPGQQWSVMRAFNRRLKLAFDREGIEIPFPQRTVHVVSGSRDPGKGALGAPGAAAAAES